MSEMFYTRIAVAIVSFISIIIFIVRCGIMKMKFSEALDFIFRTNLALGFIGIIVVGFLYDKFCI
jgi:hypothetical protein